MFIKAHLSFGIHLALALILVIGVLGVQSTRPVYAATLIVTNSNNSDAGSLLQTINNADPGDIIIFDPSLAGTTITFSSKSLTKDVTIDATGLSSPVTLSGISQLFQISSGITVEFKNLILTNGSNNGLGGAINNQGTLKITRSVISNSEATSFGGGIYNTGELVITDTTFSNNHSTQANGGAIYNMGTATITNSTFIGNYTNYNGGAIFSYGALNITNSTFYQNAPSALESSGQLTVKNSTISNSGGFGIVANGNYSTGSNTGTLKIENTILANNGSEDCYNNGAIILSFINNLIKVGNCGTPLISSDPKLGSLVNNGGFTQTMALLPGSPAIDTGSGAACAATDQRGVTRSQRSGCDIGAYEYDYVGVYYVKPTASGNSNCQSWANACTLQAVLTTTTNGDEIWAAEGTYKPTSGTDRTISFALKNGVAIYGGFEGTETLRTQRDSKINVTTLSGDIGISGNVGDNSYHVISSQNMNNTAILDGFTITGGNANINDEINDRGGGMYNYQSNPVLTNLIFNNHAAASFGGGMYNNQSNPMLTNVIFSNNSSDYLGGGMYNEGGSNPILNTVTLSNNSASYSGGGMANLASNPSLTDVNFLYNEAGTNGGGMDNSYGSNPTLTRVTFEGNSSGSQGGGMNNWNSNPVLMDVRFSYNSAQSGSGLHNTSSSPTLTRVTFSDNVANLEGAGIRNEEGSNPVLTNVTFAANTAYAGAGILNESSNPILNNVTFSGNEADYVGGAIANVSSYPILTNTILWGDTAGSAPEIYNSSSSLTVTYSLVQGGYVGVGNLNIDPHLGPLQDNGGFTQTMALLSNSPAINAGNDENCPPTDQRGISRPQGSHCDIGAYELQYLDPPAPFNKTSPANGATGQMASPILSWDNSARAASYEYCYDTTNDSACSNWISNGASTSVGLNGLSPNTTYNWHVRAINPFGTTYSNGSGTAFRSFKTGSVPGAFNKSSPANGATNQLNSLTLKWADSAGAASYEYCYDTTNDNACSNWTSSGSSTSAVLSGLNTGTKYYWHVRAINSFDTKYGNGTSTAFWSFTTAPVQLRDAWTADGNWVDKTTYQPGNPIQWVIDVENTTTNAQPVTLLFDVKNPSGQTIIHSTFTVSAQPGIWSWGLSGTATSDPGTYTFTGSATYQGKTNTKTTAYTVQTFIVPTFEDVPASHPFWRYIEAFYRAGITSGCSQSPKLYCPDNLVTRAEMAVFIERAKGNFAPNPNPTGMFADIPYPGLEAFTPFIEQFYNDRITTGCSQNPLMYCPQNNVNRAEMATFIERAIGHFSPQPNPSGMFTDLPYPGLEALTPFIEQFYNDGITTGCQLSPLMYCPANKVTRAEMAVFIVRAFHILLP